MRGQEPNRPGSRTVGRELNRPLPTPLPPPPRRVPEAASPAGVAVSKAHPVPPAPHFVTRVTMANSTSRPVEPPVDVPIRSLASPRVVVALAASALALFITGWVTMNSPDGLSWSSVKSAVHWWSPSQPVPDEELPYITRMPIAPSTATIATKDAAAPAGAPRLVFNDSNDETTASHAPRAVERR